MASRPLSSSIGTKLLVGVTGFGLFFYLIIHIVGNLVVFTGRDGFNTYAKTLESLPIIPAIEIGLLLVILLHIYKTVRMTIANQTARPVKYEMKKRAGGTSRKTFASSTMILSGVWLVIFLLIHVRAFRFMPKEELPGGGVDLYGFEMQEFSNPLMVGFYVVSMLVVGSHLFHGISSSVQSLGFDHPTWTPRVLTAGKVIAVLISGAFIVIALWAHFVGGANS
jgi:succinate dehydrogenase / fumarate reductase, cytochrome b subunit